MSLYPAMSRVNANLHNPLQSTKFKNKSLLVKTNLKFFVCLNHVSLMTFTLDTSILNY